MDQGLHVAVQRVLRLAADGRWRWGRRLELVPPPLTLLFLLALQNDVSTSFQQRFSSLDEYGLGDNADIVSGAAFPCSIWQGSALVSCVLLSPLARLKPRL